MRRLASVMLTAGLALATAVPAFASTTVVSRVGLPAGLAFSGADCSAGTDAGGYSHVDGPPGYLLVDAGASTNQALVTAHLSRFDQLTSWQVTHAEGGNNPGAAIALISINSGDHYLITPVPHSDNFATVDLAADTYQLFDSSFNLVADYQTLTQYLTDHASDAGAPVDLGFGVAPCLSAAQSGVAAIDTTLIGVGGTETLYDFEGPPIASTTSIATTTPTLKYGGSGTVTGVLSTTGGPLAGRPVQLWAQPSGGTFAKIATATSGASGELSATVKPTRNTTYQWRFAGDADDAANTSAGLLVKVTPKVSMTLNKTHLTLGHTFSATGKVTPKLKGLGLALMRKGTTGDVKVGSGKVRTDGTYAITVTVHQVGTWNVYVKTATTTKYASGTSATWSVVVK